MAKKKKKRVKNKKVEEEEKQREEKRKEVKQSEVKQRGEGGRKGVLGGKEEGGGEKNINNFLSKSQTS